MPARTPRSRGERAHALFHRSSASRRHVSGLWQIFLNGTILDVVGGSSEVGNLVVEGGLITQVTTADIAVSEDDTVYDCTGQTLSPGLIDCHVHLHYKDVVDVFTIELSRSIEEATIDAVYHAGKLLDYGFTTIREVGTRMAITPRVRDAVNAGMIRGPRIFSCGQIITVRGGLADHNPITSSATIRTCMP